MRVKAKKQSIEYFDVEIDPLVVLEKIYNNTIPKGLSHIDDNYWYKEIGFDYHKREELYQKDRLATEEELELLKAYRTLRKMIVEKEMK